jgi:hypothetical protein
LQKALAAVEWTYITLFHAEAFLKADKKVLAPKAGFFGAMGERGIGGSKCGSTGAVVLIFQAGVVKNPNTVSYRRLPTRASTPLFFLSNAALIFAEIVLLEPLVTPALKLRRGCSPRSPQIPESLGSRRLTCRHRCAMQIHCTGVLKLPWSRVFRPA